MRRNKFAKALYPKNLLGCILDDADVKNLTETQEMAIEDILQHLKQPEQEILRLRFVKCESYQKIGERYSLSTAQAMALAERALYKVKTLWEMHVPEESSKAKTAAAVQKDLPIEDLDLSSRAYYSLKRSGINKVSELMQLTRREVLDVKNLGGKSRKEISEKVRAITGIILGSAWAEGKK